MEIAIAKPKRLTLYELAEEYLAWESMVEEAQGEVTPELEQLEAELLGKVEGKTDAVVAFYNQVKFEKDAAEEEAARIKKLAEQSTATAKRKAGIMTRLANLAERALVAADRPKFEGTLFTIARQKNGGAPVVVPLVGAEKMPEHYQRWPIVAVEVNKDALREALVSDDEAVVTEARQYAELAAPSYRIVFK